MKLKRHFLPLVAAWVLLLPSGVLPAAGAPAAGGDGLQAYFAAVLSEAAAPQVPERSLRPSRIERERKQVWQAWQAAVRAAGKMTLPPLLPLDSAQTGRWPLPQELEPSAVMPFYYGKKGGERPEKGYPFFLYLHGSGPKEAEWATGLALCRRFDDAPSVYFIPQIPNEGQYYRWWQRSKQYAWRHLLRNVLACDSIDPDRLYVFGISEGGYGSQRLAAFYADYWAAAGPMAGGEPLENAPAENLMHVPFSLLTGEADTGFGRCLLTARVRAVLDSLEAALPGCYAHRVELIPGRGHAIDYFPTTPWLKAHERPVSPRRVAWEDFEMDGEHREGFYNIRVLRRPSNEPGRRTFYRLEIADNCVNMRIDAVESRTAEAEPQWGIPIKEAKTCVPATGGRVKIYVSEELVDLSRPVTLRINGKTVFREKLRPDVRHLAESCALFGDPRRLYPAAVEADY